MYFGLMPFYYVGIIATGRRPKALFLHSRMALIQSTILYEGIISFLSLSVYFGTKYIVHNVNDARVTETSSLRRAGLYRPGMYATL